MPTCEKIYEVFKKNDLLYFTGVPDTIIKHWISFIIDNEDKFIHRIAANEGTAIAHAAGYYLSTGKIGVVYMQNAGLGNCVNPLTSLVNKDVFGIPVLLMIGWRGEPNEKDEPQHKKMGRAMLPLLDNLEIPYVILSAEKIEEQIKDAKEKALNQNSPVAVIVKKGLFNEYKEKIKEKNIFPLTREEAIHAIVDNLDGNEIIVSTTGKTSRELFEYREKKQQGHSKDFYVVGSMGHTSAIAMEIACQKPIKKVYIFDGDGALLMHTGTLATIGFYAPKNLIHIVFDNCSHESTGGQPTVSRNIDIAAIALACRYENAKICTTKDDVIKNIRNFHSGPVMFIIKVKVGSRKDLGRPSLAPEDNKNSFMNAF